jgi:hypothetical protein
MSHYQYGRGGMFGFTLTGDPEQRFIIEGSEDFDTWVLLLKGKLTVAEPFVEFIDADSAVLPKRFYRARPDVP